MEGVCFCCLFVCFGGLLRCVLCRFQRAKPVIIDPGLYMSKKQDVFWITQRRSVPTAFKLFTGKCFVSELYLNMKCMFSANV